MRSRARWVELWGDDQQEAVAALGIRNLDHLDLDYLIPGTRAVEVFERIDWDG
jgi:hypothetical protein